MEQCKLFKNLNKEQEIKRANEKIQMLKLAGCNRTTHGKA